MFERREGVREWFNDIVEKFRQKGAVSPEKAMTAEELGLPPRFQEAMKRRLGRIGVFVEVNGKYYLSEARLKQIEEMRSARGSAWNPRNRIMTLRLFQLITIVLFVTLFILNLFIQSWELRIVSIVFLVVWLVLAILQIFYLSRLRKRYSTQQVSSARAAVLYHLCARSRDGQRHLGPRPGIDYHDRYSISLNIVEEISNASFSQSFCACAET